MDVKFDKQEIHQLEVLLNEQLEGQDEEGEGNSEETKALPAS